jgi:hypothetical protein
LIEISMSEKTTYTLSEEGRVPPPHSTCAMLGMKRVAGVVVCRAMRTWQWVLCCPARLNGGCPRADHAGESTRQRCASFGAPWRALRAPLTVWWARACCRVALDPHRSSVSGTGPCRNDLVVPGMHLKPVHCHDPAAWQAYPCSVQTCALVARNTIQRLFLPGLPSIRLGAMLGWSAQAQPSGGREFGAMTT